jgi:FkbM family methyltransferase
VSVSTASDCCRRSFATGVAMSGSGTKANDVSWGSASQDGPGCVVASVIIPAHDAAGTLGRQLEALAAQEGAPPFEVLVVANRCSDATPSVAASFVDRLILRVIVADERPSAAYARNQGAAAARGRYLLFCDADDEVSPSWVSRMVAPLEDGRAELVGGLVNVVREGLPDWIYDWRYSRLDGSCIREAHTRLPYAIGASLATTRDAFRQVGGFDERFSGAGAEETDLCWRLLRAGYKIGEAPDATIRYQPRRDFRTARAQARGYVRGEQLLAAKEGRPNRRPSVLDGAKRVVWTAAHELVRRREFHPLLVSARCVQTYDRWAVQRKLALPNEVAPVACPPDRFDFGVTTSTPLVGGLAFATGRPQEARWYARHGVERRSLALLERFLPLGGVFVDVGANVGIFSVAAAKRVGEQGRVIAFEPDPRSRALLTANVERHRVAPWVEVRAEAVGDASGTRSFRSYENTPVSGFGEPPEAFSPGRLLEVMPVPVATLSEAVDGRVDMVKVDVEGFEVEVLRGADALLVRNLGAVLLLEFNPASMIAAGRDPAELLDMLPPGEWELWLVDEDAQDPHDGLVPLDRDRWARAQPDGADGWYANLLARRRSSA